MLTVTHLLVISWAVTNNVIVSVFFQKLTFTHCSLIPHYNLFPLCKENTLSVIFLSSGYSLLSPKISKKTIHGPEIASGSPVGYFEDELYLTQPI